MKAIGNLKTCVTCRQTKPLEEFNKDSRTSDGLDCRCRECSRARSKKYRETHPETCDAASKRWREENAEHVKARQKAYREKNREELNAKKKIYRQNHPEKIKAYTESHKEEAKAWRQEHREELAEYHKEWRNKNGEKIRNYYQMEGTQADCVVTDPPYNVAYTGGMQIADGKIKSNGKKMIKNDKMDYTTFYDFLYAVFSNLKRSTKQKAGIYVFYAHSQSRAFLNSFYDAGLKQCSIIIWYKKGGGFGDFMAQYMNAYEPCLFGTVGENNPIIYGSNGETVKWNGASDEKTIWELEKEKKCDLHPTMKPVALFQRAISNSSQRGDTILDLFGGSGTTIIAAAGLGRKARVMEADPHFCDVIRKRWTAWAKDNGFEPGTGALK